MLFNELASDYRVSTNRETYGPVSPIFSKTVLFCEGVYILVAARPVPSLVWHPPSAVALWWSSCCSFVVPPTP
jgi:hypothetical protein